MNEEAVVESHHHHHSHSPQQSQMIDSIEKDRLDDVVVEEDENVPEIELKKKRESIGNQSDDSIENQPCIEDENDEDEAEAESRIKQEIIEERINTRGVKFVADSAIVGGTNPSLISSTNSNISSTSSMSKSSSLNNNNNNNNTNSNPSQTSPSSQQPQQPSQQQQQSSANSQSSSPSLSVSPRLKSQTNSKSEKISPGLAKRVQAPEEEDNNQNEEQHNPNQEEENVEVVEEKQTKITTLAGSSNRRTMAPSSTASSKSASSKSAANPAAAAAKIQNALEKNMQRLNLYRPNSQSAGGHKQQHAANLSKEDIELFTNPDYDSTSTTIASSSSINGSNGNQDEDVEYSTTTTTSRSIKPTGTVGGPYYLGKIPEHKTVEQSSSKTKGQYQQQQQCQQVINRSSTDREMTPDSIDNDTPQHRVSTRPNTGSRLVSKRGVNTSTSTSRNIPNSKKTPINQRTQPQSQPQPQPQKPAQQKIGVGKVNGNRKIVIPDEEEEERYEKAEDSRCSNSKAVAVAKKVTPAAAAASVQQLDEEDELNNGVYIEEQDEDELDEDEYERYHRHHHHHHHHDHDHYEDEEDDDEEYLDEDQEQHDDYDDDYEDEQDHSHNAHAMYNNQRHGYHHYPHDHDHHHAHHRQHQHQENNNTNKINRSQYTKTNNYNNPIPKPIEPKTPGAVSSSSRTTNNTNSRQDQVSKTRRVSTESESSTSKASANANKAATKQGKSEAMSRSATSGDCSARRPGGPVRRKSTTASDDREFIDTDEETNKLLDTARTVAEYHDEETDEDKARRNGQDKSAVAAKSSNPSTSSQDNDRNVDRQQKSKETQPPPSTTHQIMDPDNQVLIEGVLFRARYLGSTQLVTDGNPTKLTRMLQAQEAVGRIKAPEGESQPSVEVDLFVSTEKIMVLNTDLQEIMMDHSLRSISYIADIGNLVVLMAKRRPPGGGQESGQAAAAAATSAPSKILCHVFESPEAQLVAQSIGQAFQVAYMEYLRANGIDDLTIMKDLDYQEVLNQQEIMGNELAMFAKKECQKEVLVPKQKNEPLGLVIVESGWGSMLPTVVVANMAPTGPAARCGALNIGDQIISCNGISMVGLPLSTCQTHVKNTRHLTLVRLVVVPCPPVVEVLIKRPDTKYQLGFSVQDGIICSLLRGGIAERGGVRVGHRIIEINGHSVVATTHDKIVNMLANSVGELRMKTMPTQMFRLLTGQELPVYI